MTEVEVLQYRMLYHDDGKSGDEGVLYRNGGHYIAMVGHYIAMKSDDGMLCCDVVKYRDGRCSVVATRCAVLTVGPQLRQECILLQ